MRLNTPHRSPAAPPMTASLVIASILATSLLAGHFPGRAAAEPPQRASTQRGEVEGEALVRTRALLAALAGDDPDRADIMHMLALLLEEEAAGLGRRAWAMKDGDPQDALADALLARSKAAKAEALKNHAAIIDEHPTYARVDEVRFAAAALLLDLGQRAEAARAMQALIDRHPTSALRPHALLSLAEAAFADNNVVRAEALYRAALDADPSSSVAPYARYKLAWCLFNLNDHPAAWAIFLQIAKDSRASPDNPQAAALAREASKDAVLAYAQFGDPAKALAAFETLTGDPKGAQELADRLLSLLVDIGKTGDALPLAEALLALPRPRSARLKTLVALVEIRDASGVEADTFKALKSALAAAKDSDPGDPTWAQAVDDARRVLEPRLWRLIGRLQAGSPCALGSKLPCFREAVGLYLRHFPSGPNAERIRALTTP